MSTMICTERIFDLFLCVTLTMDSWQITLIQKWRKWTTVNGAIERKKEKENPGMALLRIWEGMHEDGSHVFVELCYSSSRPQCVCKLWASKGLLSSVLHEAGGSFIACYRMSSFSLLKTAVFVLPYAAEVCYEHSSDTSCHCMHFEQWEVQPLLFFCLCVMEE